jgi:hypothetical protein
MKYDSSKKGFVPGFGKQKSVTGNYVSDDNSKTNPLADSQLMSDGGKDTYGGYDDYSVETRKDYKSPKPSTQDNGRETQ